MVDNHEREALEYRPRAYLTEEEELEMLAGLGEELREAQAKSQSTAGTLRAQAGAEYSGRG